MTVNKKGLITLVKLWTDNLQSPEFEVRERAKDMLFGAFETPQDMIKFMNQHGIHPVK